MENIALVFPGQGSQYVGMGNGYINNFPRFLHMLQTADDVLRFGLSSLIGSGEEKELALTVNSQPAILAISCGIFKLVEELNLPVSWVAGHSVGEYSALVAAGAVSYPDALSIVRQRGELMQQATAPGVGGMAAVLGMTSSRVVELCESVSRAGYGVVEPAAFNSPEQTVVAGHLKALEHLVNVASQQGAKRAVMLQVSGPFHSSLMQPAGQKLKDVLEAYSFQDPVIPLVSNVTAEKVSSIALEKKLLIKQLSQVVRWEESVRLMINEGVGTFIEIGPGRVLSGLIRRIAPEVTVFNTDDLAGWNKLQEWAKRKVEQ
jgi:[acyl-carrier-protein] S-malonyltransferase